MEMALEYQTKSDQENMTTYSKHGFQAIDAETKQKHAAWYISSRILSTKRLKDVKWNWKDFENMKKGQNGWYLQTTYSKVSNLIKKNQSDTIDINQLSDQDFRQGVKVFSFFWCPWKYKMSGSVLDRASFWQRFTRLSRSTFLPGT